MKKNIYLASPYGFSAQWKEQLLPPFVTALEGLGAEVWEPFTRNNQVDFSEAGWAYKVGQADLRDVVEADAIFAIVNGTPPDEGVMVGRYTKRCVPISTLIYCRTQTSKSRKRRCAPVYTVVSATRPVPPTC